MSSSTSDVVLAGEVYIDVTLTGSGEENKLRFGGIVHAARGLWAAGVAYEVGVFSPAYATANLEAYLSEFGCVSTCILGTINGSPNVILIGDPAEVGHQGYEDLLRDEKAVSLDRADMSWAAGKHVVVFPGKYDWQDLIRRLPEDAIVHVDFAYDVASIDELAATQCHFESLLISTSSEIFESLRPCTRSKLINALSGVNYNYLIVKENRGGSALYDKRADTITDIPAYLEDETVNSVGVGDVYDAIYVSRLQDGEKVAAAKASKAASAYAQTTFPDVLKTLVARAMRKDVSTYENGVILPWDDRQNLAIYVAAPDFEDHPHRAIIDRTAKALEYHNFKVIRPVVENGELPRPASMAAMRHTYGLDRKLLASAAAVIAIPLGRDPGTLVEVGLALEREIPVVVFDPFEEALNTMVVGGAAAYSVDLGVGLNALFRALNKQ